MTRRRWLLTALLVVVAAIAAASAVALVGTGDSARPGPLVLPRATKSSLGAPVRLNAPYSYGLLVVVNRSNSPLVLDKASLVKPESGIAVLGSYGLPVPNRSGIGFVRGYLPAQGRATTGLRLAPHAQLQIVFGVKLTRSGRYGFRAVALSYRAEGHAYRTEYPVSGRLCAPFKTYVGRCPDLMTAVPT